MNRGLILAGSDGADGLGPALALALSGAGWQVGRLVASGVADEDTFDAAFDRALEEAGELGGLVLLADTRDSAPFAESDSTAWTAPLFDPLAYAFLTARRAVDELVGGGEGGRILVVVTTRAAPGTLAATQQAALVSLARSIATEYGRSGITCNALIVPGGGSHRIDAVAESARFLLSDDASYVTAEVVNF